VAAQQAVVYTVPVNVQQPQVYVQQVPNNFPTSTHISNSTFQVEQRLNHHYAQQQQFQPPPAYGLIDNNNINNNNPNNQTIPNQNRY
jgi:hypothetical protein